MLQFRSNLHFIGLKDLRLFEVLALVLGLHLLDISVPRVGAYLRECLIESVHKLYMNCINTHHKQFCKGTHYET